VLTEESEDHAIPGGRFVVVDEIDGTVPYAAGADTWGVMIAVIEGSPTHGVIHLPQKDVTITAERGCGCLIGGDRVTLEFDGTLAECIADAEINGSLEEPWWTAVHGLASETRAVRCLACAAAETLDLLAGVTQVYLNPRGGKVWDFAAPALAIEEAGGRASAADGTPLRWDRLHMSFLACASGRVAEEVLDLVRQGSPGGGGNA
jgi:myo-inositol-1(or 4)-monophosphatase